MDGPGAKCTCPSSTVLSTEMDSETGIDEGILEHRYPCIHSAFRPESLWLSEVHCSSLRAEAPQGD